MAPLPSGKSHQSPPAPRPHVAGDPGDWKEVDTLRQHVSAGVDRSASLHAGPRRGYIRVELAQLFRARRCRIVTLVSRRGCLPKPEARRFRRA